MSGEKLNIEIHDSGPGLSPQAKATLFEPSISFKKGGMGLGLSIVQRAIRILPGHAMSFASVEGRGSRFSLYATVSESMPAAGRLRSRPFFGLAPPAEGMEEQACHAVPP